MEKKELNDEKLLKALNSMIGTPFFCINQAMRYMKMRKVWDEYKLMGALEKTNIRYKVVSLHMVPQGDGTFKEEIKEQSFQNPVMLERIVRLWVKKPSFSSLSIVKTFDDKMLEDIIKVLEEIEEDDRDKS